MPQCNSDDSSRFFLHLKQINFSYCQGQDISISGMLASCYSNSLPKLPPWIGGGRILRISNMATAISPTNIPATPTGCGWNICGCCYLWVLLLPFDLSYTTLFLRSSTVKKMTELKSRGVKMLPSKDNQHKISVCKCQPQILHSPANKYLEKCNML